jgi:cysteine desulfurase
VYAAAGSSCASGALEPSHVLEAMGLPRAHAREAVRFSLGYASTDADVDRALAVVPEVVGRLRDAAPAAATAGW